MMKDEIRKLNEEKIRLAKENHTKIHLILRDKTWRNGYVKEISGDFFIFEDDVNGDEPIFFLELSKVEPYIEPEKKGGENGHKN